MYKIFDIETDTWSVLDPLEYSTIDAGLTALNDRATGIPLSRNRYEVREVES